MNDYDDPYAGLALPPADDPQAGNALQVHRPSPAIRRLAALPVSHFVDQAVEETAVRHELGAPGLKTSLATLNPHLGEMYTPGKLSVIAGSSGVAKTTILSQLAVEFAEAGVPVFLASMEDDGVDTVKRMLANVSNGHVGQIRSGFRDADGTPQAIPAEFDAGADQLRALPLTVANEAASVVELAYAVAGWRQGWVGTEPTGVVIVDQLSHLLTDDPDLFATKFPKHKRPPRETAPEHQRLEWQVSALREVARVFGVVVIVAHQLNDAEDDAGKPTLKSLRGSRGIVHHANSVLVAHRPARLPNPAAGPGEPKTVENEAGRMWLLCLKFREGESFELEVTWHGAHQRVADLGTGYTAPRAGVVALTATEKTGMTALAGLRSRWGQHLTAAAAAATDGADLPAPPAARRALGTVGARWALPAPAVTAAPAAGYRPRPDLF